MVNGLGELLEALKREFGWSPQHLDERVVEKKLVRWASAKEMDLGAALASATGRNGAGHLLWEVAGTLSVNETYFFRGRHQLEWVVEKAIPDRLRSRDRAVVWSAGCSSGEEAYSLLFLLAERAGAQAQSILDRVAVFGTDLDESALETARQGVYSERSLTFRATDPADLVRFFEPLGGGLHRVKEEYRRRVFFLADNLAGSQSPFLPGSVDVCLCRNVLYYMTPEGRRRVFQKLARSLAPGGYLLLGETEVIEDHPELDLRMMSWGGVFVLRKGGQA